MRCRLVNVEQGPIMFKLRVVSTVQHRYNLKLMLITRILQASPHPAPNSDWQDRIDHPATLSSGVGLKAIPIAKEHRHWKLLW